MGVGTAGRLLKAENTIRTHAPRAGCVPSTPKCPLSQAGLSVREERVLSKEQAEGPGSRLGYTLWPPASGFNYQWDPWGPTRLLNNAIFAFFVLFLFFCPEAPAHFPTPPHQVSPLSHLWPGVPPLELEMSFWRSLPGSGIPKALLLHSARMFSTRYVFLNGSGELVNKDKPPLRGS